MLKKIYYEVVKTERDTIERERRVDEAIQRLTADYEGQISNKDMDTLKDLMSSVALEGEETGFEVGARFVIRLLRSLF